MEAIGLVASIITLISAASHAASLLERVLGHRGIPLYVLGAINEVTDFEAILTLVKTTFEETQHQLPLEYQVEFNRLSDRAMGCIDAFTKHLRRNVLREREGAIGDHKVTELKRRVKWMEVLGRGQAQGQIDSFQQELASLKLSFVLAMSATNLKTTTKLSTVIQDVTIVHGQDIRPQTIVHEKAIDLPYAMEKAACMGTMSSTTDDTLVDQQINVTSYVKIETLATTTNRTCKSSCPCDCHVPCQGTTPRWLRGLIGSAFFSFNSVPLLNRRPCNYGHCCQSSSGAGSLQFRYFFPTWLLPLGIEVAASWRSLDGVGGTWSIKIPRFITDRNVTSQLRFAICDGTKSDLQCVMQLYGVKVIDMMVFDQTQRSILNLALAYKKSLPFLMWLLNEGADPNCSASECGLTVVQIFHINCMLGRSPCQLTNRLGLQDTRDELNLAPATELLFEGSIERLRDLLQKQPSALLHRDSIGKTPLHWAAMLGNDEAIDVLVEAGADVHAVGCDGLTPLYDALRLRNRSRTTCIRLVQAGSDVNHTTSSGLTPLIAAVQSNSHVPVVDVLIDAGADVQHRREGRPLLHSVAGMFDPSFVFEELLSAGVDIDAQLPEGLTAVMSAVICNSHFALKMLIDHNAQLNNITLEGYSIVHHAAFNGDIETMQILEQACIEGLPMDDNALEVYWLCFDERARSIFSHKREPLEDEEAAFEALLDSITPAMYVPQHDEHYEDSDGVHIPGAFPIDPDESDCDSRIQETGEWDDDDFGCEEKRDSDDESWITTDDDCSGGEEDTKAAIDDDGDGDLA